MTLRNPLLLAALTAAALHGQAQPKQSLLVTTVNNVTTGYTFECGGVVGCLDNRSTFLRHNNYHSLTATGPGTWQVQLQGANGTPTSWTTCGSAATVTQSSNPPIAFCYGYYDYLRISITGSNASTVIANYGGQNQLSISATAGSVAFPISWLSQVGAKPFVDAREFSADSSGFAAAIAGASGGTLVVPAEVTLTSDLVVPDDVSLVAYGGGIINVSSGHTLTVNGSFDGDLSQHFAGPGIVVLNATPDHYVQWWGAKGNIVSSGGGSMTMGSNLLTASGFTADVVGRSIVVFGVDSGPSGYITTTITSYVSPTQVHLGVNATVTNASAGFTYGSDDTAAIQAAVDSIVSGAPLNGLQHAPAGVVKFPPGSYFTSAAITPCHTDGCPDSPTAPAGVKNAGLVFDGLDRTLVTVYSVVPNINMFEMYMWSAPSAVRNMTIESSGAGTTNVRVKGNLTTLSNLWMFGDHGIVLEESSTTNGASGTQIYDIVCDSVTGVGGPGKCITGEYDPAANDPLALNSFTIDRILCFAESYCISFNAMHNSIISNVAGALQGQYGIQLSDAHNITLSNINLRSTSNNSGILPTDDGIELLLSSNISIAAPAISNFSGPAIRIDTSTGISISDCQIQDNVLDATTTFLQDIYMVSSEVSFTNCTVTNNSGHPVSAIKSTDSGFNGSYAVRGTTITGTAYTGTVIDFTTGGSRVLLADNYFKNINSGGSAATILLGPTSVATISGNTILQSGSPTNWLLSSSASTNLVLGRNFPNHGNTSINGVSMPTFTTGIFSGSTLVEHGQFGTINSVSGTLTSPLDLANQIVTTDGSQTLTNKNFNISIGGIGHGSCWKTGGFPGYCSTVLASDGSCTCN